MSANSTKAEQAALLAGLMVDESQVRQACLQALAVSSRRSYIRMGTADLALYFVQ